MKQLLLLIGFCYLGFSLVVQAQEEPTQITDKFFEIFETAPLQAMDYAFATNSYLKENTLAIETLKKRYTQAGAITGVYKGFETITVKTIGDSFRLYSFLVKFERIPLRFTFIMYRASNTWRVNQLFYDDTLLAELEASAKQDRM